MTRRYAMLAAASVIAAVILALVARMPRSSPAGHEAPAPIPETRLALAFEDGRLTPEHAAVPKGHRVVMTLANHDRAPLTLELAGYQDRVRIESLPPGASRQISFIADLPGDDFAWIRDGHPVGILRVTGSHLEEGHR